MAILIDYLPSTAEYAFSNVSKGRSMSPTLGSGPERVIQRPGDKTSMKVTIPAMSTRKCGPALAVDLLEGIHEGVVIPIPEPKVPVQNYGAPKVDQSGQGGRFLNIYDAEPGVVVMKGKWLSIVIGGQRYAYLTRAEVTIGEDGKATLPIRPMIRVSPAHNSVVELARPMIEGLVKSDVERQVRKIGDMTFDFLIVEKR